jgi:uncharacterized protein YjbI with pentapeptide repeats
MANPEHLAILKQGVEVWNKWRVETPHYLKPNLNRADLSEYDLRGADLKYVDLVAAKLSNAYLQNADLTYASLEGANLVAAKLCSSALVLATLSGARVHRTDFSHATFGWTSLGNMDLSDAQGLDRARHLGPSIIGVDTLARSSGKVPIKFLQGCGVSKTVIAFFRNLEKAVQFNSCFISYATEDQPFADQFYTDLQNNSVRCWFAPHAIQGGKKIYEQIDEAIRVYDRLLLILSDASMNSEWVKTEIANARQREIREGRKMLFPISLVPFDPAVKNWKAFDADTGKDLAREIREYFIPDFSNWRDPASYRLAFERLLRDLKAGDNAGS